MPFDGSDQILAKLTQAQEILRTGGWVTGQEERDGQHCLMGAVFAAFHDVVPGAVSLALLNETNKRIGPHTPEYWNDNFARSVEEVIEFLGCVKARL